MSAEDGRAFLVHAPIRDLDDYRAVAEHACKLKPYGQVHVNITTLATKSFHEIPAGGSPWHQYASNNPCLQKFFPHEKIAPFIPAEFVHANRSLLLAKAEILRKLGLGAAFWSYEPNYLPEAFFMAYPHLRGPRVDHPRRSLQEAFAPCLAQPETQEMISSMVTELIRNVPEVGTYFFKTNDAGPGICWSDWQYTGPNGPAACRNRTMGQRVRDLLDALNRGAEAGGGSFRIHMTGNFSAAENRDIESHLPDNAFMRLAKGGRARNSSIKGMVDTCYPCRAILNAGGIMDSLKVLADGKSRTVFVSFRPSYDRGYEDVQTAGEIFDMAADYLADPVTDLIPMLQKLRGYCDKWAGKDSGEKLLNAMVDLRDIFAFQGQLSVRAVYWAVSLRHITRPLVAVPANLTDEEESYWLDHVFNVSRTEARQDYLDIHGGRPKPFNVNLIDTLIRRFGKVIESLESIAEPGRPELLSKMAKSLRIYCCFLRSCGNFYRGQLIRDRNVERLAEVSPRPPKVSNWTGDPDLTAFNDAMRDELDNMQDLIGLLENGGMEVLCHATDPTEEDTFLLGPDLIDQLKQKVLIMRRHWRDIESHLTTPHK